MCRSRARDLLPSQIKVYGNMHATAQFLRRNEAAGASRKIETRNAYCFAAGKSATTSAAHRLSARQPLSGM